MLRLMSDLVPALLAARDGVLKDFDLRWYGEAALAVVMAAKGYPGPYSKGSVIGGLEEAAAIDGVEIFHAGTRRDGNLILADGGRVLDICAIAPELGEASSRAYAAIERIRWPEGFCRRDIGWRALARGPGAPHVGAPTVVLDAQGLSSPLDLFDGSFPCIRRRLQLVIPEALAHRPTQVSTGVGSNLSEADIGCRRAGD